MICTWPESISITCTFVLIKPPDLLLHGFLFTKVCKHQCIPSSLCEGHVFLIWIAYVLQEFRTLLCNGKTVPTHFFFLLWFIACSITVVILQAFISYFVVYTMWTFLQYYLHLYNNANLTLLRLIHIVLFYFYNSYSILPSFGFFFSLLLCLSYFLVMYIID